ncbi:recombination regulator RecX [Denitratisoma sp. DHT3]|uniref:recombination regulator RecX n=1 Tax=Denitratisoma sp. DHT3 TaxID=1981880 RepID=UPI00119835AB|nr:recombination regulator RecX [Denitratisoma sp. DHT3]QDX81919.1 recombination regulator RecX [Denitratisoma sp. DHT3]
MNDLKPRAIRLLARREHSRAELARKLSPHGSPEEVDTVLTELQNANLLSDARFADSYLRSQGARLGAAKLRQTLRGKGVAEETIAARLAAADLPDELERVRTLWARKFGSAPTDAREWARQARFLQSRGFGTDVIRKVLKELAE